MAITRRPKNTATAESAAEAFIAGAPDSAAPKKAGAKKTVKQQISLKIAPELLERVDQLAAELGQSRAAVINMAIYRAVEHGLTIEGLRKSEAG